MTRPDPCPTDQRCRHFTGIQSKTCKAGVNYNDVTLHHGPVEYERRRVLYTATRSLPCLTSFNHCGATCPSLSFPTPEEVNAEGERRNQSIRYMLTARAAIVASGKDQGYVKCPQCGQRLSFRRAQSNGHIHAACETGGCVSWME
jgi:hypothetical protein